VQETLTLSFDQNARTLKSGLSAQMFSTHPSRQANSSVKEAELGPQDEDSKVLPTMTEYYHLCLEYEL